ncbi:MAG: DUF3048 domain-containing protein [Candidatus Magasanikbacteria bacterium]|nr:DUF3048 domain-containing protein [Candidatus Magasanikbacteria bacterium]
MSKRRFNKSLFFLLLGLAALFLIGIYLFFFRSSEQGAQKPVVTEMVVQFRSRLDGAPVETVAEETPRVVGVMVDNHPDARPQAGISFARVVYEAPVEGGFTRYLALFNAGSLIDKVGPVRSARPYFLDWLEEYGITAPMYMHSGGSPDALAEIKRRDIFDTNEFYWGEYYWRSDEADPPHNLFTKSKLWQALLGKFSDRYPATTWQGWIFSDTGAATSSIVKALAINYTADYTVGWRYEADSKKYRRLGNGRLFSDREGRPVLADNILILEMPVQVLDEVGRKAIATTGSGSARVFHRGEFIRGTWKKTAVVERTRVYDANRNEMTLIPGITWVEIVPTGTEITVTQ